MRIAVLSLFFLSCSYLTSHGDIVTAWDNDLLVEGATGGIDAPIAPLATTTFAGFTTSTLTRGGGLTSDAGWPDVYGTRSNNSSLALAISNDAYFTFTVTPAGVSDIDYTNFHLELSSATSSAEAALFSDALPFSAGNQIADYVTLADVLGGVSRNSYDTDLSAVSELQDNTDVLEFRLYVFNVNRLGIGQPFRTDGIDDLSLSGTVAAVPEASAAIAIPFALVITGLGSMIRRRRVAKRSLSA